MLKFTSMTITNFGPYAGEQTIDFSNGDGVTLIWGDNGHGKTTLLNLFRYALFGKFQYRHETIEDILKLANKEGVSAGRYEFKVVLRMIYDDHHYELTRQYCLRDGVTVPTKKDDYQQEMYLKVDGHFPPNKEHELALIMPEDVSRFFLFDGELLQEYEELVKEESGSADKIKKSIETILGVPVLTNGATDTDAILREYRDQQTKAAQANTQTQKYAAQIAAETAKKDEQNANEKYDPLKKRDSTGLIIIPGKEKEKEKIKQKTKEIPLEFHKQATGLGQIADTINENEDESMSDNESNSSEELDRIVKEKEKQREEEEEEKKKEEDEMEKNNNNNNKFYDGSEATFDNSIRNKYKKKKTEEMEKKIQNNENKLRATPKYNYNINNNNNNQSGKKNDGYNKRNSKMNVEKESNGQFNMKNYARRLSKMNISSTN